MYDSLRMGTAAGQLVGMEYGFGRFAEKEIAMSALFCLVSFFFLSFFLPFLAFFPF